MPQPKDKPMLVQTRTALFEVLGTRSSVDAELAAATLTVTEGSVRATKLSDNSSVDVPAQHRVTAAINRELVTEKVQTPWVAGVVAWNSGVNRIRGNGFLPEPVSRRGWVPCPTRFLMAARFTRWR